jgi:hypothetical protein
MGSYDTSDLRRRQQADEVGHAVLGSTIKFSSKQRRRAFLIPLVALALGILLALWGPVPGLGLVLTIGGVFGLVLTAGLMLGDGLS